MGFARQEYGSGAPSPSPYAYILLLLLLSRFSHVRLCATPETAAHQAPLSLGFSRQEHWSGLPFPSPMHESEKWKWSCPVVSDSSWPHGLQPIRLLRPWDLPGKSTGVGCHRLLCMHIWASLNNSRITAVSQLCPLGQPQVERINKPIYYYWLNLYLKLKCRFLCKPSWNTWPSLEAKGAFLSHSSQSQIWRSYLFPASYIWIKRGAKINHGPRVCERALLCVHEKRKEGKMFSSNPWAQAQGQTNFTVI